MSQWWPQSQPWAPRPLHPAWVGTGVLGPGALGPHLPPCTNGPWLRVEDLDPLHLSLMSSIGHLEAAVRSLVQRVAGGELRLVQVQAQLEALQGRTDGPVPALGALEQQLQRLESQLGTGERRLSNQEQALRTMSRVVRAGAAGSDGPERGPSPAPGLTLGPAAVEDFPSLQRDGQQQSAGSLQHPAACKPCTFYCFTKRGCKKGSACEYCHMLHISRTNRLAAREQGKAGGRGERSSP
mmetsp:Transcript_104641/g.295689  ORF Transcript_104641/g.295689 Transcript_104641/m.295689 type:complete len:239 (+) Transcript_104641:56-772(+)